METASRKQWETLNEKLRAVTEQARQQRVLQKKTQRWQSKKKKDIEDVSFILFVRAAPDASTALWYAAREAAATGLPIEITEAALETRCLNTDVNTLATISKGSGGMAKGLLATADRVHKEHDLRGSIQHQNDLKGVAPTTALVLKHLAKMHEDQKKQHGTSGLRNARRPQHQVGATLPPSKQSAERSFRPRKAPATAGPRTEGPWALQKTRPPLLVDFRA
jgi:hypothetical protein